MHVKTSTLRAYSCTIANESHSTPSKYESPFASVYAGRWATVLLECAYTILGDHGDAPHVMRGSVRAAHRGIVRASGGAAGVPLPVLAAAVPARGPPCTQPRHLLADSGALDSSDSGRGAIRPRVRRCRGSMYPVRLVYNSIIGQSEKLQNGIRAQNGTLIGRQTQRDASYTDHRIRDEAAAIGIGSADLKGSLKHIVNKFLSLNSFCHWICTNSALARVVQISANVHPDSWPSTGAIITGYEPWLVNEMTLPIKSINVKELEVPEEQNRIKHQSAVEGLNKLMDSLLLVCANNLKFA